ncbi:MAG: multiheme c-type cytochrome [Myxococcota bacterium]
MIAEQRAKGPLVVVDGGNSLAPPVRGAVAGGSALDQRRIKAELIADATRLAGIDAMALGPADWSLGVEFVRNLVDSRQLPVLAANLTCDGAAPYPGGKVVEVAGKKLGFVGVTLGPVEGCEVGPAVEAMDRAVAALGPVDVVIGLVPADGDRAAAEVGTPSVDLVIDSRGRAAGGPGDHRGAAMWVSAGSKGKTVALMDLAFVPGATGWSQTGEVERLQKQIETAEARLEGLDERLDGKPATKDTELLTRQRDGYRKNLAELKARMAELADPGHHNTFTVTEVQLEAALADHPETAKLVADAKTRIAGAPTSPDPAAAAGPRTVADTSSPFVGGEVCVGCHQTEHDQWSTTGHARAWQSLTAANRAMDDDCWSCHVTGAKASGGPDTAAASAGFRDVQCEACHGAGRAHAAAPAEAKLTVDPPAETCRQCHDGDKDGGRFDFTAYRPKVLHGAESKP